MYNGVIRMSNHGYTYRNVYLSVIVIDVEKEKKMVVGRRSTCKRS